MRPSIRLLHTRPQRRSFSILTSLSSSARIKSQESIGWQIENFPHPDLSNRMRLNIYLDASTTNHLNMIRQSYSSETNAAGRLRIRTEMELFSRMPSQYLAVYKKTLEQLISRTSSFALGLAVPTLRKKSDETWIVYMRPDPHGAGMATLTDIYRKLMEEWKTIPMVETSVPGYESRESRNYIVLDWGLSEESALRIERMVVQTGGITLGRVLGFNLYQWLPEPDEVNTKFRETERRLGRKFIDRFNFKDVEPARYSQASISNFNVYKEEVLKRQQSAREDQSKSKAKPKRNRGTKIKLARDLLK